MKPSQKLKPRSGSRKTPATNKQVTPRSKAHAPRKKASRNLVSVIEKSILISREYNNWQAKQKLGANKNRTIAQHLLDFLKAAGRITGGPSGYGTFTGKDFLKMMDVLNGTADNFFIFDNAGGKNFTIWFCTDMKSSMLDFKSFIKKYKYYGYMYKIKGKETILRALPVY